MSTSSLAYNCNADNSIPYSIMYCVKLNSDKLLHEQPAFSCQLGRFYAFSYNLIFCLNVVYLNLL